MTQNDWGFTPHDIITAAGGVCAGLLTWAGAAIKSRHDRARLDLDAEDADQQRAINARDALIKIQVDEIITPLREDVKDLRGRVSSLEEEKAADADYVRALEDHINKQLPPPPPPRPDRKATP